MKIVNGEHGMMNDQTPTEEEISALLENIHPQPGTNLRARVAHATWHSPRPEPRRPARAGWVSLRRAVFATLGAIGVLIVFFAIPPFNGIAQRVSNFFYHSDQDTLSISVTPIAPPRPAPPGPSDPLPLAEAERQAGFTLHKPQWLPEGFEQRGVIYAPERDALLLDYYSPTPNKFLRLTQIQLSENRNHVGNIGASADVQMLEIRLPDGQIVTGEYVTGAWRLPAVLIPLQTGQPDMTATMQANWDPDAKIHMLRWLTDGFLFEIIHADPTLETLSSEMLVKIAESMDW